MNSKQCDYCQSDLKPNEVWYTNQHGYHACPSCYELILPIMKNDVEDIETLPNGAKQSKLAVRMDLLPWSAILQVAEVLRYGAEKYGENNWRGIPADSHLNHALRHIALYMIGDSTEDHKKHAACRILMWLETK